MNHPGKPSQECARTKQSGVANSKLLQKLRDLSFSLCYLKSDEQITKLESTE